MGHDYNTRTFFVIWEVILVAYDAMVLMVSLLAASGYMLFSGIASVYTTAIFIIVAFIVNLVVLGILIITGSGSIKCMRRNGTGLYLFRTLTTMALLIMIQVWKTSHSLDLSPHGDIDDVDELIKFVTWEAVSVLIVVMMFANMIVTLYDIFMTKAKRMKSKKSKSQNDQEESNSGSDY